jgi:hypothetical protein
MNILSKWLVRSVERAPVSRSGLKRLWILSVLSGKISHPEKSVSGWQVGFQGREQKISIK